MLVFNIWYEFGIVTLIECRATYPISDALNLIAARAHSRRQAVDFIARYCSRDVIAV